ncbi:transposable element Tcb2 transposase [Trichonephila clavipes]|nr:transposable element Tcb2 transposase [Trichonephila clavipes]
MCSRRHGGGRVRSTTPAEDRYIVLSAKRNRRTTAQQVANQFLAASGKQISRKTVARRLRGGGLYARRPVVCVPLTRQHRTARLQWCREHHNWTEQDWACVLFSDESRFSLSSDCRRQLIWHESGTAYRPENIQEKDRYPTCSIMVWAGIMINGRTRLHVVANGTMTGQRYIDEVLLPHVRLFRGAVGDKFVFMDDNATCHRTLAVQDCLDSEDIQRLVWPARSPDLNPIKNVWDALGRQVVGRYYPPTNKNTLIRALTEEWDKLPQQLLDYVVQSMVRRVECCITLPGGHIPVSLNVVNKLGWEVETIVWSHNCTGKHGRKAIGGALPELARSAYVISSLQTETACDEHESLYERRVDGYPLHLRPSQRKWTCCCSFVWGKISDEAATESSNVRSGASELGGTWIFQCHD